MDSKISQLLVIDGKTDSGPEAVHQESSHPIIASSNPGDGRAICGRKSREQNCLCMLAFTLPGC